MIKFIEMDWVLKPCHIWFKSLWRCLGYQSLITDSVRDLSFYKPANDKLRYLHFIITALMIQCGVSLSFRLPNQTSFIFISRKDMTKIAYIIPAVIRKVAPPTELYKNPPKVSPMILARPPKLPATPCTAP
jgi:hypothetical protein